MLSHLKNVTCSEKSPAKVYIFETQIAAVILSLTVEANHNAAAFILGCYTPISILSIAYAAQLSQNGMSIRQRIMCI